MLARVSRIQGQPDRIEDAVPAFQQSTDMLQGQPGFEGGYLMVNRETGEIVSVTLWDGEPNQEASTSTAEDILGRTAHEAGAAAPAAIEVFEVVLEV